QPPQDRTRQGLLTQPNEKPRPLAGAPSRRRLKRQLCRDSRVNEVATHDTGGEGGIRTLDGGFVPPYSLSRGAPSAARPPLHALLRPVRSWRRVRDSNPRTGRPVYGFQDRRLRPLGQPSGQPPGCRPGTRELGSWPTGRRTRVYGPRTAPVN